jgi:hypothetical protein
VGGDPEAVQRSTGGSVERRYRRRVDVDRAAAQCADQLRGEPAFTDENGEVTVTYTASTDSATRAIFANDVESGSR